MSKRNRENNTRRDSNRKVEINDEEFQMNRELKIQKITPKNEAQSYYMRKINGTSITFGIGPAGTGKTWLATVMAAQALKNGITKKIVITRPAVEVGKSLGFLPGEMDEKFDPFLRPIADALNDALGSGAAEWFIKREIIEARPLQYLRGSTLKDCWVIADEMQNSTPTEMKMLLSRIGEGAKYVINGDPKQKDIPGPSGLLDGLAKCRGLSDVAVCEFTRADIVRSGLARLIIDRYEGADEQETVREGLDRFLDNNK